MNVDKALYIGGFSECPLIKDDYERLCCELEELRRAGEVVVKTTGSLGSYTAHHWTVLKLVFLKMYVRDVYTPIIGKRYPYMVFIDLFAGKGLNTYNKAKFYVPGSSLIAWFFATYPFDKIYTVGYDKPSTDPPYIWLSKRLHAFIPRQRFWLGKGDANVLIDVIRDDLLKMRDRVRDEFGGGIHFLAFIDPDCHEARWSTIEKLINLEKEGICGDFIILLQARLIARIIGKIRSEPDKSEKMAKDLDGFFGTDEWREFIELKGGIEQRVIDLYTRRLEKLKKRALIEKIDIELMREDVHYYLIYITRETKQGSPYLNTVKWLKEFVERVDKRKVIDNAIRTVLGIRLDAKITDFA